MIKKKTYLIIAILVVLISGFVFIANNIGKEQNRFLQNIKYLIPSQLKEFVKENIFIYQYKEKLEKKIISQNNTIGKMYEEIENVFEYSHAYKFSNTSIEKINFENNLLTLKKFTLSPLKFTGPRSYIQFYDNKLFLINGNGTLMFTPKNNIIKDNFIFYKIDTNLINKINQNKEELIQVKDFLLSEEKIFVSFLSKKNDSCFYNSIFVGDLELEKINFEKFFSTNECRKEATPSVGGNLSDYKDNKILLTIGDYYCYEKSNSNFCKKNLPQSLKSFMGKIISIDKGTKDHNILSIGHRNSQGLFYDEENNIILSTDHGPEGGDEINLNLTPDNKIKNYGWPISSYGEHYEGPNLKEKYEIAPLHKSHSNYGFVEPLKHFTPALGISQIIKTNNFIDQENYEIFVGSLGFDLDEGDLSLHSITLNENFEVLKTNVIPVYERVRDIEFINELDILVLFLETSGSILTIGKN